MLGGPADSQHAERLATNANIINLVGKTSLQEAAELIKQSDGVIGVDTGLTHMGHGFQKPTIALFGSTRPYERCDANTSVVLFEDLACAPCKRRPTCNARFDCMQALTPQRVLDSFLPLIGEPQ